MLGIGNSRIQETRFDLRRDNHRLTIGAQYAKYKAASTLAAPFSQSDTDSISADELQEIDPRGVFAEPGSSFEVSSIFRDAVVRVIALWYRI